MTVLTKVDAENRYGAPFGPTMQYKVLRMKEHANGSVSIYIHNKVDGVEQLPLGYILGDNIVIIEDKQ